MKLEELKQEWTAAEIRLLVKMSALEMLQRVDAPPDTEKKICQIIDEMTEDEIYKQAYNSYLNCNN